MSKLEAALVQLAEAGLMEQRRLACSIPSSITSGGGVAGEKERRYDRHGVEIGVVGMESTV